MRTLQRMFPPPMYLKMPVAGIDISDEAIRYTALKESGEGVVFDVFGEQKLSEGTVQRGEIQDAGVLTRTLKEIAPHLDTPFVHVSLPEEKAYVVRIELPHMKRSEIRGNIELRFEEHIPIPVNEAVFDYDIVRRTNEHIEIALAALPRETVESYRALFRDVDLVPLSFEIESHAIARAVVPEEDAGTYMIVDFEHTKTGISVVSEGVVVFTASVAIGGSTLIAEVSDQEGVSPQEARKRIRESGVAPEKEDNEFFTYLLPTLSTLRDEINKHFIYWQSHEDESGEARPQIEKIILCGEHAALSGLTDYLSSGMRATVEQAHIIGNMNSIERYVPEMDYIDSFKYVTAIGLARTRPK